MTQAGKQLYLVANWKSYKTLAEARAFVEAYRAVDGPTVILCPPFPYLWPLSEKVVAHGMHLGAQDISQYPFGAYTGAVAAAMLTGAVEYVIVGHSERRTYFRETHEMVAQKVREALQAKITPIVCVDEPYMATQLAFFSDDELARIIVAYEPLAAIGSGTPDTPERANMMAENIIQVVQSPIPVLYGGSVTAENVRSFVTQPSIAGVLVGGASLNVDHWQQLVESV